MTEQFIEKNKVVSFTYSIVDKNGELLEQSDLPISYVHGGKHDLFEKVVEELDGSVIDDTVEVSLTPEEAFGAYDPELTYTDDLENVPPEFHRIGAQVEMMNDKGDSDDICRDPYRGRQADCRWQPPDGRQGHHLQNKGSRYPRCHTGGTGKRC